MPGHKNGQSQSAQGFLSMVKAIAIAVFALSLIQWLGQEPDMRHFLADTDSYVRLTRIHLFWETGQWNGNHLSFINAPYGLDIHWTKLLDGLLLLSAMALKPFMTFKDALFYGSFLWNPLFLFLSAVALAWGIYPYLNRKGSFVCALVLATHPIIQAHALPNRIDHHLLQVFLLCVLMGVYMRLWHPPLFNPAYARTLGIVAAVGVWVSFEFVLAVAWLMSVLWITWLQDDESSQVEHTARRVSLWFLGSLLVLLFIERGGDSLVFRDIQRLSLFHVLAAFLLFLALHSLFYLAKGRRQFVTKMRLSALVGSVFAGVFFCVLRLSHLSLDFVNPQVRTLWFNHIREIVPLYSHGHMQWDKLPYYALCLGGVWGFVRARSDSACPSPVFTAIAIGFAFFNLSTFYQFREMLYLAPFLALTYALWASRVLKGRSEILTGLKLFGIVALGQFSYFAAIPLHDNQREEKDIDMRSLFQMLADPQGLGASPKIIFALSDREAAALPWYTPHRVVYAPYHENVEGILDRYALMRSPLYEAAKASIYKRGVDYLLIRRTDITDDTIPDWLVSVPLPPTVQKQYVLLKVI